ncbi:MAG: cytoplasmic protein [Peptostreptococcaceae bacterium]|nr:cytoplasmic protein [Peptostreptococcaceae bacterium]
MQKIKILFAGESAVMTTTHIKGVDSFTHYSYSEGVRFIKPKLEEQNVEVVYMPCHDVMSKFPMTVEELKEYDCIVISDLGSNSLLFHPNVLRSQAMPNRLDVLREYVSQGGAFLMIGGYMTFAGIENKARYHDTPIEELLPVEILNYDDRVELPEGFHAESVNPDHPILKGLPSKFPMMLFYNKLVVKKSAELLLVNYEKGRNDPILVVWDFGNGRAGAFAPDCAPHGATPEFLNWSHYGEFFAKTIRWLARK